VVRVTPGKYTVGYAKLVQSHPSLSTGFAEFEVKSRSATGVNPPAPTGKK
jgi:hypothetical protein